MSEQQGCCGGSGGAQNQASAGCCGGAAKAGGGCCQSAELTPLTREEVAALPTAELLRRYRRGVENYDRRVFYLSEAQINQAFLPDAGVGRWPVRVLLGHIADAELAYVHRMRRAFAEANPMLAVWDEEAFVDSNIYGNAGSSPAPTAAADQARVANALGGYVAVVHTLRQWSGAWLQGLTDQEMERKALHPERGPLTVRDMAAMATWHLEHHSRFLTLKLDRMVGQEVESAEGAVSSER